jgi:rod shape-determining protein MreC
VRPRGRNANEHRSEPGEANIKALFLRESGAGYLLLALGIVSVLLAVVDAYSQVLRPVRETMATIVSPVYFLAAAPYHVSSEISLTFAGRSKLIEENRQLRLEVLELAAAAQQISSLREENVRLRDLLGSRSQVQADVLVAELIGARPAPSRHHMVLDKGASSGVFRGQAVVDARGLFGQVIEVGQYSSVVMLISDPLHAVPVQVLRNDFRSIAAGTGRMDEIELEHVPVTADIAVGDLLVSSGMGGGFPRGYPVAEVVSVAVEPTDAYTRVSARPLASLDRSRHVLLIFPDPSEETDPPGTELSSAGDSGPEVPQ